MQGKVTNLYASGSRNNHMWIQDDGPIKEAIPFTSVAVAIYMLRLLGWKTLRQKPMKLKELMNYLLMISKAK